MANTCSRCQTYVASGRTYCDAHYQEAMADYQVEYANYQNALQQYYVDVEAWNEMSVEEQNAYHEVAEEESLSSIAIFAGLVLGGGFWFFKQDEIPWWMGALITVFSAVVFYVGRNLFSKLLRGTWYGILWALGLMVTGWIIEVCLGWLELEFSIMETAGNPNVLVHTGLAIVGLLIGFWNEFTGAHHAYGGPVAPIEPSRPSP